MAFRCAAGVSVDQFQAKSVCRIFVASSVHSPEDLSDAVADRPERKKIWQLERSRAGVGPAGLTSRVVFLPSALWRCFVRKGPDLGARKPTREPKPRRFRSKGRELQRASLPSAFAVPSHHQDSVLLSWRSASEIRVVSFCSWASTSVSAGEPTV